MCLRASLDLSKMAATSTALTLLGAPLQQQQQAGVPLAAGVVLHQQGAHQGQRGQSLQLQRLLLAGVPMAPAATAATATASAIAARLAVVMATRSLGER